MKGSGVRVPASALGGRAARLGPGSCFTVTFPRKRLRRCLASTAPVFTRGWDRSRTRACLPTGATGWSGVATGVFGEATRGGLAPDVLHEAPNGADIGPRVPQTARCGGDGGVAAVPGDRQAARAVDDRGLESDRSRAAASRVWGDVARVRDDRHDRAVDVVSVRGGQQSDEGLGVAVRDPEAGKEGGGCRSTRRRRSTSRC